MKKLLIGIAVSFLILNMTAVFSERSISLFSKIRGTRVTVDNIQFDALPIDEGNDSILKQAADTLRKGPPVNRRIPDLRQGLDDRLPRQFRVEHTLRFGPEGNAKEICSGKLGQVNAKQSLPASDAWEYLSTGDSTNLDIAIKNKKGRKSIVLIDRNRGTFLSITQAGG